MSRPIGTDVPVNDESDDYGYYNNGFGTQRSAPWPIENPIN